MRIPRIVQFRLSAPSRWKIGKEEICLVISWVVVGLFLVMARFQAEWTEDAVKLGLVFLLLTGLLINWTIRYFTSERKQEKKVEGKEDEGDDGNDGRDYKPPTWISPEERTEGDFVEDKPWLVEPSEDYTLETERGRPRVRRIKGPIHDDH